MLRDVEQREAMLEAILKTAVDAIITIDERGTVESANPATETLFGYAPEELLGQNIKILMPSPYQEEHDGYLANYMKTGKARIIGIGREVVGRRKDGTTFPIELAVSEVRVGEKRFFTGVVRDVTQPKEARVALEESESRYRGLIESSFDLVQSVAPNGELLFANRAWLNTMGYTEEEAKTLNLFDLLHADCLTYCKGLFAKVMQGESVRNVEATFVAKDGRAIQIQGNAVPVFVDGQVVRTNAFLHDVTELRNAEEENTNVGRIIEDSLNEVFIFDAETFKFVQVNRGARENLGYSMNELKVMTPLDIKPGYSMERFVELIDPLTSGKQRNIVFYTRHERKDGSCYDVEIYLQMSQFQGKSCFVAIILDITERKKAEASLRVQERALESAVNGILITDPTQEDNPIVYVNQAMQKMTGYSAEEVIGYNCRFLQNDDREQEALAVLRTAIQEERECKVVLRNFRKDGTLFWNELTVSPVRDNGGKLVNFVGIQSDITERIRTENELTELRLQLEDGIAERTRQLEATQQELVQSEKMATLGQVSGGIAHEIKNPLNAIKLSAYYLLNAKDPPPKKVTEHLQRIDRQVNLADNVISALSKFAKLPEPELNEIEIEPCLSETLSTISLPGNIEVRIDVPANAPKMLVDDGQIMIVFRNLIRNARDAMPEGGQLLLAAEVSGQYVSIIAQDTGIGIPEEILDRVLEPLFSTKARGMGLGLAISRAIVEKHDGELSVTSEVGSGSRFAVKLKSTENGQVQNEDP